MQSVQKYRYNSKDLVESSGVVSNGETSDVTEYSRIFHPSQLLRTLLNAARKGNLEAYSSIGDVFYKGAYNRFEGASDYQRAMSWYGRAAARGVAVSHFNMAFMHQFGLGVPVNLIRAQKLYEKVIQKASSDASSDFYSIPVKMLSKAMLLWVKKSQKSPLSLAAFNAIAKQLVHTWYRAREY